MMSVYLAKSFVRKIVLNGRVFTLEQSQIKESLSIVNQTTNHCVYYLNAVKGTSWYEPHDEKTIKKIMELAHVDRYILL